MSNNWTDNETRELIDLWPIRSAEQIAAELHRSRSAVASKAKRLHLDGTLKHLDIDPHRRRRGRPPKTIMQPPPPADHSLAMQPCTILDLDNGRCHWPVADDDRGIAALYCGGSTAPGRRYCQVARNG